MSNSIKYKGRYELWYTQYTIPASYKCSVKMNWLFATCQNKKNSNTIGKRLGELTMCQNVKNLMNQKRLVLIYIPKFMPQNFTRFSFWVTYFRIFCRLLFIHCLACLHILLSFVTSMQNCIMPILRTEFIPQSDRRKCHHNKTTNFLQRFSGAT